MSSKSKQDDYMEILQQEFDLHVVSFDRFWSNSRYNGLEGLNLGNHVNGIFVKMIAIHILSNKGAKYVR